MQYQIMKKYCIKNMAFFYMLEVESTPMTEKRKTMSMLLTISYFCIFRYINKAGLYIPPNIYIYIFILSMMAVCFTSFEL